MAGEGYHQVPHKRGNPLRNGRRKPGRYNAGRGKPKPERSTRYTQDSSMDPGGGATRRRSREPFGSMSQIDQDNYDEGTFQAIEHVAGMSGGEIEIRKGIAEERMNEARASNDIMAYSYWLAQWNVYHGEISRMDLRIEKPKLTQDKISIGPGHPIVEGWKESEDRVTKNEEQRRETP